MTFNGHVLGGFLGANPQDQQLAAIKAEITQAIAAVLSESGIGCERLETGYIKTNDFRIQVTNYERGFKFAGFRISGDIPACSIGRKPWAVAKDASDAAAKFREKILPRLREMLQDEFAARLRRREAERDRNALRQEGLALIAAWPNFPLARVNKYDPCSGQDIFSCELPSGQKILLEWHYGEWRITLNRIAPENIAQFVDALTKA